MAANGGEDCPRPPVEECEALSEDDLQSGQAFDSEANCYVVDGRVRVDEAAVEVPPETTIYFEEDGGIEVSGQGRLLVRGQKHRPVCLTGLEEVPGFWRGILLYSGEELAHSLSYTTLEYAGHQSWGSRARDRDRGGLLIRGDETAVEIEDSLFRFNQQAGVTAVESSGLPLSVDRTEFVGNDRPLWVHVSVVRGLGEDLYFEDNKTDKVIIDAPGTQSNRINDQMAMGPLPYYIEERIEIDDGGDLVIEGGARLYFAEDEGIEVGGAGRLKADGNNEHPVYFGATTESPGHWRGIFFEEPETDESRLMRSIIEYAGSEAWGTRGLERRRGAIVVTGDKASLVIEDSQLRHNKFVAINSTSEDGTELVVENTIFKNNDEPIQLRIHQIEGIATSNVFIDNGLDRIILNSQDNRMVLEESLQLPVLPVPYQVRNDLRIGDEVIMIEGTTLYFEEDIGLEIRGGRLLAQGSSTSPVRFLGAQAVPGYWKGIVFRSSFGSSLVDVEVRHGGSDQWHGGRESSRGNVVLSNSGSGVCGGEAQVQINRTRFADSANYGLAIRHGSLVTGCGNLEFQDNMGEAVYYRDIVKANPNHPGTGGCFCDPDPECLCE